MDEIEVDRLIVVGLGNIGKRYTYTRHNAGFRVVDKLAELKNVKFKKKHKASIASFMHNGMEYILVKPQTYMNLSGEAIKELEKGQFVVIYDELDLPLGSVRVREKGRSTHNGVKSIKRYLDSFIHHRIGIGRREPVDEYVLSNFTLEENKILDQVISKSIDILLDISSKTLSKIMSEYN